MSRRSIVGVLMVLVVALGAWWFFRAGASTRDARTTRTAGREGSAKQLGNATPASPPMSAADRQMWAKYAIRVDRRALDAAIATGDPAKWRPLLGQARHFNVPREEGIHLLRSYLDNPDVAVRAAAAQYLFELGSRDGGPVLTAILTDAAAGHAVPVDLVTVAGVLHQYRYPMDADLIFHAYEHHPDSRLLMYAQLLGSPLAEPVTRERLRANGVLDGAMTMAGMMRLKDPASLAIYEANLSSPNATNREQANWAMFRATGDEPYLDYLIGVAEERVGLRPRTGNSGGDAGPLSFLALQQNVQPGTTAALERIEQAARQNGQSVEAGRALVGLFYYHHEYRYIDDLILQQFSGTLPDGLRIGSIWNLAAARRTPEIAAAARSNNQEAYDREFIRKAGRPLESWIFQYISPEIPADIRPPLVE